MNVSAIIVTRGDQEHGIEDLILPSLPDDWEVLVWDNGRHALYRYPPPNAYWNVADLSVYGRYAAIEHARNDLIYVQDDDCVVSDPALLVRAWQHHLPTTAFADAHVVCNMPQEFRHEFYEEHALVGFGACFHRDAPQRAWGRFADQFTTPDAMVEWVAENQGWYHRTCDVVFTGLTPRVLVDVPVENLPWASAENRMWKQPEHQAERARMLELVKGMRDAGS